MSERDGYVTMVSKKGNENLEYFSQIIMNYFLKTTRLLFQILKLLILYITL